MPEESFIEKQEEHLAGQIFSVSAGMVGVCLTVIGLMHISSSIRGVETIGDDLTAFDAIVFILACFLSYSSMKTRERKRRLSLEQMADRVFLSGLSLMVVVCVFVVYTFSVVSRR